MTNNPMDNTSLDARRDFIKDLVKQSFGREEIVVRLSNPDAMLDNSVRVENEVAAITLMEDALSVFSSRIVPAVYGWSSAAEGQGWMAQDYMRGELLSDRFPMLLDIQKKQVLDQVAQVFKMIQSYTPKLTGCGGLNFDNEGKVVIGGLTIWFGGPFAKYTDMYLHIFRKQIEMSTSTPLVNGWKATDLGERLENFDKSGGFAKLLNDYSELQPTLIHGDLGQYYITQFDNTKLTQNLSLENILFDPETLQLTGLLDFDFAHIASPADEFFYSFMDFHGIVPGPFEGAEMETLRLAQLDGFQDKDSADPADATEVDWKTARLWHAAMEKSHVKSIAYLENIGELAAIYWFLLDVCPPYYLLPRWLNRRTEEHQLASKREIHANLDRYLKRWSY